MHWDDARIFLAVARSGQFLAAARVLRLNHATVARRINALEADIGSKLFVRRTTGTELSPAGERFLPFAERIESEMISAGQAAGASDVTIGGTVRIGAPDGFGVGFLASRLGRLSERHPNLKLELVPVPRAFSLSRREADIAVTLERPRKGRLVAKKLVDFRLGLYAAQGYLDKNGIPASLDELHQHRLVGHVEDLIFSPSLDYTSGFFKDWRSSYDVSSAMGQVEAVLGGAGIGVLHRFMADHRPGLVPILRDISINRSYWKVAHESSISIRRIQLVSEYLDEIIKSEKNLF